MNDTLTADIEALLSQFRQQLQARVDRALLEVVASIAEGHAARGPAKLAPLAVRKAAPKAAAPKAPAPKAVAPKAVAPKKAAARVKSPGVDKARVLDLIGKEPKGIAIGALAGTLGADKLAITKALRELRDEKRVKLVGEKRLARWQLA